MTQSRFGRRSFGRGQGHVAGKYSAGIWCRKRLGTGNLYLARHPNSKYRVDFEDFSFYGMDVVDVYFVGGFGVMGWVSASEYNGGAT